MLVKIPEIGGNPFIVQIGNKKYTYKPGAEVDAPDEVAQVIRHYYDSIPRPAAPKGKAGQVWTRTDDGEGWEDLPEIPEIPEEYVLPAASASALGGVKQGIAVADATSETAATQLNALIASLVAAGVIAEYIAPPADPEE